VTAKNPTQLKAWIKNLSKETSVEANIILQNYMLERLLERISVSRYKDNFILKGRNVNKCIRGFELSEENLTNILNEIIQIDVKDDVLFELILIKPIREEADYNGFRVTINAKFKTIIVNFKIDITAGDKIIPKEIEYKFNLMLEDRTINVLAYNLETVISEKIETIISRNVGNTRARDYYDLYIIEKLQKKNYNPKILKQAVIEKFKIRNTEGNLREIDDIVSDIENSQMLKDTWDNYRRDYSYAEDITFENTIDSLKEFIKLIK